jgi:hypothetical protein
VTVWTVEIAYRGRVPHDVLAEILSEFEFATVSIRQTNTVLTASVADQAALLGVLNRLQDLGLTLSELRRLPRADNPPQAGP